MAGRRVVGVLAVIVLALGAFLSCGGHAPTAPHDPGRPAIAVVVRCEGVEQRPVLGEYRFPKEKAGSVHWLVILPDVDRSSIRVEAGYESCLTPYWSYLLDGNGYHGQFYYPILLASDAQEYLDESWQAGTLENQPWQPSRVWPEPDVCYFVGTVTVTAPEYPTPVSASAQAVLRLY